MKEEIIGKIKSQLKHNCALLIEWYETNDTTKIDAMANAMYDLLTEKYVIELKPEIAAFDQISTKIQPKPIKSSARLAKKEREKIFQDGRLSVLESQKFKDLLNLSFIR